MDQRNTNPGRRTSQRSTIDGRPAPRRSTQGYEGQRSGHTQGAPRSQRSTQSSQRRNAQSSRYQRSAQASPRSQQQYRSARSTGTYSRSQTPRRGNATYVQHGYQQPSKLPYIVGGVIALLVLIFLIRTIAGALSAPAQPAEEAQPAASDTAVETTSLTISFAGDCTLGTDTSFDVSTNFDSKYDSVDDPSYFFANVASIFANDDLSVANMEGTLTTSTNRQDKTYAFKGPAEYANILVKGNIETVSLANNHSHDYGDQSYTDTIAALENAGLGVFGYDRIDYRDVNGVKVALIGTYELADGLACQDEMKQNIQTAKNEGAQITIVYFHWGEEKETVPNETQVELGHIAVDAGADLVIGSHPHVIQGYEKYNGRYIVYSLGNFCFGGNKNPSDKDCMIFQQTFTVTGNDVATDDAINVIPCSISSTSETNNYQPTPAEGSEKTRIEEKIQESCDSIATLSAELQNSTSSSSDSTTENQ